MADPIVLQSWNAVRDAFRSKELRQAGYSEGAIVTADTLLDLHGDDHRERRRVENRLFRREIFSYWEHQVLGTTVRATLTPFVEAGRGDLAQIGYRSALSLTATIAGIDHDPTDAHATERLYAIVKIFSEGATLMHSTRNKDQVRSEVAAAMATFETDHFAPSVEHRQSLLDQHVAGLIDEDDLPKDVLTTLLRNHDRLALAPDVVMREMCLYLQAGAHSTANAFTHTVDDLLAWSLDHPSDLALARTDIAFVQRCMHESLRLNPASPMAYRTPLTNVTLSDGTQLPQGSLVVLDLTAANSDTEMFGPNGGQFDPHREVPEGAARWGLSFGAGAHACIGAELDGGLEIDPDRPSSEQLFGTVAVMAHAFLEAGGGQDPANPPTLDPNSTRKHYSAYPVVFTNS
ncbi:MAG: cytochrome P450 [Acidimicrobiales bacterium]|jgi:cytochrome P450